MQGHYGFDKFSDYADLYLLTDTSIPWQDDGTRFFPLEDDRQRFFEKCENELINRGLPYIVISGADLMGRIDQATFAIDQLLAGRPVHR